MPVRDDLGMRMKHNYESVAESRLTRRMPVAIRLDGKAFHTFTRGFRKPFDPILVKAMQETMEYLCENIQGCLFGYMQSDEITLILVDYQTLESEAWFDYRVQKMCSVAASMATMKFNQVFSDLVSYYAYSNDYELNQYGAYMCAVEKGAMFDARVFNIPKEEVTNLVYWRQLDAMRNSVLMVGQANFSHKELQCKSCEEIKEMLRVGDYKSWEDYPIYLQRGTAWARPFGLDLNMPILKGEDRKYLDEHVYCGEGA